LFAIFAKVFHNGFIMCPHVQTKENSRPQALSGLAEQDVSASKASRIPVWLPLLFGSLVIFIALLGLLLLVANYDAPKAERWGFWGFQSLAALMVSLTSLLITRRYPNHPIGWLLLAAALFASLTGLSEELAIYALHTRHDWLPAATLIAGMFNWFWVFSYAQVPYG